MEGPAFCVVCKHKWTSLRPTGTVELECPICERMTGVAYGLIDYDEPTRWTCHCGNDLFRVTPDRTYCPCCGKTQKDFK